MGSFLSMSSAPPPAEQKKILGITENAKSPIPSSTEPLFFDEVNAEPAAWSDEPLCRTIQRFFGLLSDSPGEVLKNEQQYPLFRRRSAAFVFNVGSRIGAIVVIQRFYRSYRRLLLWQQLSDHMVQLARGRLAAIRAQEQENISAASFRFLLSEGFSASKVCISGALKTIQLQLVLNPEGGECYLTWTPSRKNKPRINLHDIEQVTAVQKEGNPEAPRLSKKVSYRRGIIIVCKSYHRGRIVLELATKQERNILLQGFQKLLSEMISTEPTLDEIGALRNHHPRRQSAIKFFRASEEPQVPAAVPVKDFSDPNPRVVVSILSPRRRGSVAMVANVPPSQTKLPAQGSFDLSDSARADAKAIEHFYQTRFDESPDNASQSSRRPGRAVEARH